MGYASASQDIQEYMDEIYDNIDTVLHTSMLVDYLTLANLTQDTTFGSFAWGTIAAGGDAGDKTPPGVCLFTWARTLKPRVQIRKYWGVFTETSTILGAWTAAARTACINAMTDHINSFAGTNGLTVLGVAYNRTLKTWTDGLSVASSAEPAYQRRRRRGRGS